MTNLREMTNEEVYSLRLATSIKVSTMQSMYLKALNEFGKEHETTQYLWNEFVTTDEATNPIMVEAGQRMMREQMEHISPEEWASIVD